MVGDLGLKRAFRGSLERLRGDVWRRPDYSQQPGGTSAGISAEREPETGAAREIDGGRHDSDDGVANSVQTDRLADDLGVGVETLAPDLVSENDDRGCAGRFVGGGEVAAQGGGNA